MYGYEAPSKRSERISLEGVAVVPLHLGQTALWVVTREGVAEREYSLADARAAAIVINASNAAYSAPVQESLYPDIPLILGCNKSDRSQLVFDDEVSRPHAALLVRGRSLWVRDLNSKNGTYYERPVLLQEITRDAHNQPGVTGSCVLYRAKSEDVPAFTLVNDARSSAALFDSVGMSNQADKTATQAAQDAAEMFKGQFQERRRLPNEAIDLAASSLAAANRAVALDREDSRLDVAIDGVIAGVHEHAALGYRFAAVAWAGNIPTYLVRGGTLHRVMAREPEPPQKPPYPGAKRPYGPPRDSQIPNTEQYPSDRIDGAYDFKPRTAWFTVIPGDQIVSLSKDVNDLLTHEELLELCLWSDDPNTTDTIIKFVQRRQYERGVKAHGTGLMATRIVI